MKKIKSVKLKNDFNNSIVCFQRGTPLYRGVELWKTTTADLSDLLFTDSEILNNKTDLFEIEYEEERKYIDVRIEYYNDSMLRDFDISYFKKFEEDIKSKSSHERKVELTIIGRGSL